MKNTNLISPELIHQAKSVSIVGLLQSVGAQPLREMGNELIYYSPLRNEKTPSFFVNPAKNCFTDFGGDEDLKGDSIRLARLIWNVGFKEAVQRLLSLEGLPTFSFSFSGLKSQKTAKKGISIISVQPLRNPALIQYVRLRGISLELARIYLKEISYQCKGKPYFALGLENDLGGFELRSKYFQGSTDPKYFSTIKGKPNGQLNIFEGFFDFLSCCQHHQVTSLASTTLILNSVSLIGKALPSISEFSRVGTFLDNDDPGKKAVLKLEQHGICIEDHSATYKPYKDYSDFWSAFQNGFSSGFQSG